MSKEPIIDDSCNDINLRTDIGIRGAWQPQQMALFDIRVLDSDAPSYLSKTPEQVLREAEKEKKRKYSSVVESQHSSFTPLCVSVDGLVGPEFSLFVKCLSDRLAAKWEQPYCSTINWIRTKLSIALVRASNLCIRGTRAKWRGLGIDDGWGINLSFY